MITSLELPDSACLLAEADWPGTHASELPAVAGFVTSGFSPLVAAVAEKCLAGFWGAPPVLPGYGEDTAIVLTSATGDLVTTAAVGEAVVAGRRVPPLLFYQSNHNAVAGYVAARWGLRGPVVATMPGRPCNPDRSGAVRQAMTEAMTSAALLIDGGDALAVLVVVANCYLDGSVDGRALLLGPASWSPADAESSTGANLSAQPGRR